MILKQIPDKNIHDGHRGRMRAKLAAHGSDIFDTYELLEMLLYTTIPYKDTNPIAKRLLAAFGDLEGVFSASKEELMMVDGIGEKTAEYIKTVELVPYIVRSEAVKPRIDFNDYETAGRFFADRFKGLLEYKVSVLFLDNSLIPIKVCDLYSSDFTSAAIKPRKIIEVALDCRASVAILAHNHPFGPLFPSESDVVNNGIIDDAMAGVDVMLLEHYVISGDRFFGFMKKFNMRFAQTRNVRGFLESKKRVISSDVAVSMIAEEPNNG
ncbi:MAG: RadC family protein [Clostridia bacterium]|nr:RadC family protein [Clostridia bacterium]